MYVLDLNIQHTNMNSQSFQLKHAKAQFLIFAEANLPNCDLEFRRSALLPQNSWRVPGNLTILVGNIFLLHGSGCLKAFYHIHYESLEQQYHQQTMVLTRKIVLQNSDKCCPCCQSSSIWLIFFKMTALLVWIIATKVAQVVTELNDKNIHTWYLIFS